MMNGENFIEKCHVISCLPNIMSDAKSSKYFNNAEINGNRITVRIRESDYVTNTEVSLRVESVHITSYVFLIIYREYMILLVNS